MTHFTCSDGMCGAEDCKTCHPLLVDDEEDLQDEEET